VRSDVVPTRLALEISACARLCTALGQDRPDRCRPGTIDDLVLDKHVVTHLPSLLPDAAACLVTQKGRFLYLMVERAPQYLNACPRQAFGFT
jgi:hypothetical protein